MQCHKWWRAEFLKKLLMRNIANSLLFRVFCLVAIGAFVAGCSSGKRPFLLVQGCLGDAAGVDAFVVEMTQIARDESLRFIDGSSNVEIELNASGYDGQERTHGSKVLHLGIVRPDGSGVTAGNIGLPGFEVALGFSEGSDAKAAMAFATRVVERLERQWRWQVVPQGQGALPMGGCP